jgi:TRAP-type mannitol/chloroaromatic compound transport system substrate-binding protein
VSELTDGKFELQPFAAGEIVPGLQVLDAVANGTVESGFTYMGYYIGKNPAAIFDASLPFGLTPRQHAAWLNFGGGRALVDELYDGFGVVAITAGNTGGQMFGWFRKELKTPKDLEGLKMRTAGFGGKVMAKLGVVAQQIAGGDIYPSLERGTIDACEWVGPYDDEKLGFNKVAKYYYTPGVMELEATNQLMISKKAWATLPPRYQAAMRAAGAVANQEMLASYDAKNAEAIARLVAAGTHLSVLPEEIIKALRVALEQVLDEEAAANEQFRKILTHWRAFRANQHRWFSLADTRAENAVYRSTPT